MKRQSCRVKYSILAICYLEVLIWTTCLLSSCSTLSARPEDVGYLTRETGNLKQTIVFDSSESLPAIDLRGGNLHVVLEHQSFQRLQQAEIKLPETLRPQLYLSLVPVAKGLPAPYAGINTLHH